MMVVVVWLLLTRTGTVFKSISRAGRTGEAIVGLEVQVLEGRSEAELAAI